MRTNEKLSDWFIILNLTFLLSLTIGGSGYEIVYLDVRYSKEKENLIKFYFSKITKSWKQRESPPKIAFLFFQRNKGFVL